MYNPKSMKAEEFIDHQEIMDTLAWAQAHSMDGTLIDQILEKARQRKGLTHREASLLLECKLEDRNQQLYALAEQIKQDFYGDRIVMFAPLYLSNYCVNGCVYCPYHKK
ncbi:MAG: [FeFe] hydrogenase H-cluster radical SAM maturase HydG, partial [Ruminococcaceae bacterium]|nr:[FeFe] hydrogenase H-cluster radical SAM maturase HydG [Oscillospiraceae bacterium]